MEEHKDEYNLVAEIANSLKSFLLYIRHKWWLFILVAGAGACLGAVYYFKQQPKYKAMASFILEEKSAGGGLAGLASQFGLSIGGGGGSIFAGDNILDILKSKKVVEQVLLTRVDNTAPNGKTLADLYLEFSGTKQKWKEKPALANISFANANQQISPIQDSVLNVLYETIVKKNVLTERNSKQGTIIKVQVTAPDCLFARLLAERLVEEASKLYLDIRVGTAQENIRQLQRRSDSLLALLNNKSYHAAASQPLDINPGIRTAIVPVEIATRDKTVLATLYAEVTKNLEASKMLLSQQTPVIQLLDLPAHLLSDNKKGILFLLMVFVFIAELLLVMGSFFMFLVNQKAALPAGTRQDAK